ncbi:hypothetical protein [Solimonas sp. SE-A11]|uniref:hypothetical protein n=1 Tax=Solimonas sp. SE-A11 TaxID=3054954 RepID=UPI00259CA1F8|nr:hypothetical protein [Solimonas sp. SE-A11]MDM4771751.1 hypothetical protein [Solimonas sp. SE-A11]
MNDHHKSTALDDLPKGCPASAAPTARRPYQPPRVVDLSPVLKTEGKFYKVASEVGSFGPS